MSYCPRSSLPAAVLAWLGARLAHLVPSRPPGTGGTSPLLLEVRLDAVGAARVAVTGRLGVSGELPVAYAGQSILRRELGPGPGVPVVAAQGLVEQLPVDIQGSDGQGVEPERYLAVRRGGIDR